MVSIDILWKKIYGKEYLLPDSETLKPVRPLTSRNAMFNQLIQLCRRLLFYFRRERFDRELEEDTKVMVTRMG